MGLFNTIRMGSSAAGDYEVEQSLRFDDDQSSPSRLQRTIQSGGNKNKWTLSVWVKRSQLGNPDYSNSLGGNDGQQILHAAGAGNRGLIKFKTDDTLSFEQGTDGGYSAGRITTTAVFRDTSAWYHLCFVADYANSTTADRAKIFVNGVQQEVTTNVTFLDGSASDDCIINRDRIHEIGFAEYAQGYTGSSNWFNFFCGYMAEFYFIDGQAYDPTYFTKTNPVTGQLIPKKYSGSFGTTGWYLDFLDNSAVTATTLGKDSSGNSNNWTPNGFSVSAGAGNDSLTDTPTNNFATMNPLVPSPSVTWANGNLDLAGSSSSEYNQTNTSTFGVSSGKWYVEVKYTNDGTTNTYVGICPITTSPTTNLTNNVTDGAVLRMDNTLFIEGSAPSSGTSISSGDTIGIALDMDNQKVWFSVQGTYLSSGNPATGANATFDGITAGETIAICARPLSGTLNFNFGQRPFAYTPPTGFKTLCSANLPDPTILLPNKHFDTLLWSGNATTSDRSITGLNFQPDWAWTKTRNHGYHHVLFDAVRGPSNRLNSDQTFSENYTSGGNLASFDAPTSGNNDGGITWDYGTGNEWWNESGKDYVAWNWNAGGSTVTNNDGANTSQVRANTTAGFSIVTYTGTGSTTTFGHGLGVAPQVVITKPRSATGNWGVLHTVGDPTAENRLHLNDNGGYSSYQGYKLWNDTVPTSSVFTVREDASTNASSVTYVAYVFSEVAGYSKFGKYTGNGNADGTFVFTGFRPALVIFKRSSASNSWYMMDNKRNTFNLTNTFLRPDTSAAEGNAVNSTADFLSNGFKFRGNGNDVNASGSTYIYFAFAESPFKNARAR
jgi:hypothetical protein